MAPPKDIARSYPKRGLTADVGFRSEPKFCGDGSVYFDGSSDYAETAASADLAVGDTFTLTAWVWLDPSPSASSKYAFRVGDTGAAAPNIASIGVFGGATPQFYCYSGSASMLSSVRCDSARWYHVASVIKSGAGNSQIFVDGIDVTSSHSVTFNVTSSSSKIRIGDWSSGGNDWEGYIANACLFTESLTEDQVRQVMRASDYASHAAISTVEAFYPLSADFNDSTGNHNATLTGSVSFGVNRPQLPRGLDLARGAAMARVYSGRAVELDGSSDYLATETSAALGDTFTITAWIKRNSAATLDYVVNVGNPSGAGNAISISITNANPGLLYFFDNGTSVNTTNKVEYNTWYHVALTVAPGAGTAKLYMNGIDGTPAHSVNVNITDTTFEIGRYLGASHWFYGWISDVRVYNQTLTADQVKELYHHPEQLLPTGSSASNLIHRWALSDYNDTGGTGGRYFQDSAGSNAMEDKASASMEFAQPVPCPQLGLQQSATRHFFTGASSQSWRATVTAPGTAATLSGWMFWGDSSRISYLAAIAQVTDAADSFNIRINASGDVTMYKAAEIDSGLNINEGEWNHIVVTTKSTSPYWRCWVNGVEASSPAVAPVTNITTGFVYPGSNSTPYPLNGFINDVAFWDAELDTPDVAALYNSGVQGMDVSTVQSANLKGWWKADDLTTFKDYSGNGADAVTFGASGTIIGASFPENASGSTIVGDFSMKRKGVSVLNFGAVTNGANEYALSAKDSAFLPSFANGGSFSCFFRLQKLGEYSSIFINDDYGSGIQHRFAIYLTAIDKIIVELGDGASARANPLTTGTISDSDWHHFAFTVDYGGGATTTIKLFLDGVLDSTSTATTLAGVPNATALRFGDYVTSGANEMNGPIACPKFYQVTLSDNEIEQIYRSDLRLIKGLENV